MKKTLTFGMILLLTCMAGLLIISLTGCPEPEPEPSPTPTPEPGPEIVYNDDNPGTWEPWDGETTFTENTTDPNTGSACAEIHFLSTSGGWWAAIAYSNLDVEGGEVMDTTSFTDLHISLKRISGDAYTIHLALFDDAAQARAESDQLLNPIDSWDDYTIPLSSFDFDTEHPDPTAITNIIILADFGDPWDGNCDMVFLVDDIYFE
jgi:hypothetical protein